MWISKQEYDEVSPRRNFEVFTLSNEKLTFHEIISKIERSLHRSPKMLLSSRYSSIVRRWCLVLKQLNKTTLSLPFPLEFAPFFTKFSLCVSFLFCKVEPPCLLFIYRSPSASYVLKHRNLVVIVCSLASGCCSRVSSFVSTSRNRVCRGSLWSCRYLSATSSHVVGLEDERFRAFSSLARRRALTELAAPSDLREFRSGGDGLRPNHVVER